MEVAMIVQVSGERMILQPDGKGCVKAKQVDDGIELGENDFPVLAFELATKISTEAGGVD
jgi:hypothetical protein